MTPFDLLVELRASYPTPMKPAENGALLNAVAWTFRSEGWGLLAKPSGSNCMQPVTGVYVSRDILTLHVGTDLVLFDVLKDSEGQGVPTWSRKAGTLQNLSRWTAPVGTGGDAPPPPVHDDPPPAHHVPSYPGDHVGVQILQRLFADYERAGQAPNAGMGTWLLRTVWDVCNPPYLTAEQSLAKHADEWQTILGIR